MMLSAGVSTIRIVHSWCSMLIRQGPCFRYYSNALKTWLFNRNTNQQETIDLFGDTGINITVTGQHYLRAPFGTCSFVKLFVKENVNSGTLN